MYNRQNWVNGSAPAIDATNLNNVEGGIDDLYQWIDKNDTNDADTLTSFDFVFADTSSAIFTLNLPATPVQGDMVRFCDATGSFGTNNLTVGRNGNNIMGLAQDMILDQDYVCVDFTFSTLHGWVITNKT